MARPAGGPDLESSIKELADQHIGVVVSLLTMFEEVELGLEDEGDICRSLGIEFLSLPIPDRGLPDSFQDVERLVASVCKLLKAGKTVAIHCRMGIGRSGMICACVLTSLGHAPKEAFEAISEARKVRVPDTDEQRLWVERFASSR